MSHTLIGLFWSLSRSKTRSQCRIHRFNNIHRSVTHQTTLTIFMGKSLTRQSSQHSQISHLAINPHNIHRSVSYPDVFSVATKLPMFKVLQHSQVSGQTINPLNIHRSVSYPYKIHGSLTDLPSQHSQASLFIVLTSLYTENYLRADADVGSITLKCLHHMSYKNINEDLVGLLLMSP